MSIERPVQARDEVVMDECHIELIRALVMSQKPLSILELGIGSGAVTYAISRAIRYNCIPAASVTCVDNFFDWDGIAPKGLADFPAKLVEMSEKDFVASCKEKFDFIVSDADHENSHKWADKTLRLLNKGGIAVFHDVCNPDYPNLFSIVNTVEAMDFECMSLQYAIFSKSSRSDERCHRGLLVVFSQ